MSELQRLVYQLTTQLRAGENSWTLMETLGKIERHVNAQERLLDELRELLGVTP